jgi:hypothetical protein
VEQPLPLFAFFLGIRAGGSCTNREADGDSKSSTNIILTIENQSSKSCRLKKENVTRLSTSDVVTTLSE